MKTQDKHNGTFPTRPKPNGRPSIRNKEIEEALLAAIRQGKSLLKACEDSSLPCCDTIFTWLAEDEARRAKGEVEKGEVLFLDAYNTATRLRCDILAEEILSIADSAKTGEEAQIARVQIDARKWYVAKLSPRKYGDKASAEVTVNNAINKVTISEAQRRAIQAARQAALERCRR